MIIPVDNLLHDSSSRGPHSYMQDWKERSLWNLFSRWVEVLWPLNGVTQTEPKAAISFYSTNEDYEKVTKFFRVRIYLKEHVAK